MHVHSWGNLMATEWLAKMQALRNWWHKHAYVCFVSLTTITWVGRLSCACTSITTGLGHPDYPSNLGHSLSGSKWVSSGHTYMLDPHQYYQELIIEKRVSNSPILYWKWARKVYPCIIVKHWISHKRQIAIITKTCVNTARRCLKHLDLTAITKTCVNTIRRWDLTFVLYGLIFNTV